MDKKKIFGLYQYYLLGEVNKEKNEKKLLNWFNKCLSRGSFLYQKVAQNLKEDWDFSRLPPLEKAILIYGAYELLFEQEPHHSRLVINNVLNFSKAYLEKEKIGYINKVLDLLVKEKNG